MDDASPAPVPLDPPPAPLPPPAAPYTPVRWGRVMFYVTSLVMLGLLTVYVFPGLLLRWWQAEALADAQAAYLKRQAELRAESEAADQRLTQLDRRIHFVSLGFREVARKVVPVVVNITNEAEREVPAQGRRFYDHESRKTYVEQSEGSGLLVRPGLILTNNHVVKNAQRLRVTFASGDWVTVAADAISGDALTDLAVVRLPEKPGPAVEKAYEVVADFADSDKDVEVGDWVLAVGSPFGLRQTVTAGIVSAKGRVELGILDQVDLIQTDTAINPGNSGGPLFDQRGRVVGINVAIASRSGANQGVGFAIPSNTAREITAQLLERGEVVRGFLGIGMQELPAALERRFGVADTGGVVVSSVRPETPAADAGVQTGDVVVRFNGEPVGKGNALNQLRKRIAATPPDSRVPVELVRGKKRLTVEVTITKRPEVVR